MGLRSNLKELSHGCNLFQEISPATTEDARSFPNSETWNYKAGTIYIAISKSDWSSKWELQEAVWRRPT